nr:FHA domain-containing protein [Pyxidicoccus fallax]
MGREDAGGQPLPDERVSRLHAEVGREPRGWTVADLGSRNGTWVDGERVTGRRMFASPRTLRMSNTVALFFEDVRRLEEGGTSAPDLELGVTLRDRMEEVPGLMLQAVREVGKGAPEVHASFVEACLLRSWPGEVRELLDEVRRTAREAQVLGVRILRAEHLAPGAGMPLPSDAVTPFIGRRVMPMLALSGAVPGAGGPQASPGAVSRPGGAPVPSGGVPGKADGVPVAPGAVPACAGGVPEATSGRGAVSGLDAGDGVPAATPDRAAVEAALAAHAGNVSGAARALGLHRTQLYRLMRRWGLVPESSEPGE